MKTSKLIQFEYRKQVTSFTFIVIILIFTFFAITQLSEIFYMPVNSDSDIRALEQSGERDYIFISNTDEEIKYQTIQFLEERIYEGTISTENASAFDPVFDMLYDDKYSFEDVLNEVKDDEFVFPWINASKAQFGQRLGTIDEVNTNLKQGLGNKGYSPILYDKYVTYMQAIAAFLIFPIFLLVFTKDYKHNMFEIIYAQPISPKKYIICRYFSAFLPLTVYLYLFGLILNLISVVRFVNAGYDFSYSLFIIPFAIYILPTIFFLSTLIMFLMLLINKAVAVFPVYIAYVIFNVTPNVFNSGNKWIDILNPIIRLDGEVIGMGAIAINRIIYTVLGVVLLVVSCKIYDKLRHNLRRVITI